MSKIRQSARGEAYVLAANGIIADDAAAWFEAKADEYWERWQVLQKKGLLNVS
nr:MAG TPA: hypothetical protein [Siphoviridae sp. ctmtD6]